MISITFYDLFVYGLLTFALIALWLPITIDRLRIRLWHILCAAAMGGGLLFGYIHSLGLISMVLLAVSCYLAGSEQRAKIVRLTAGLVMFVVSVGLSLHIIPGFSNPKIVADVILSQDGTPKRLGAKGYQLREHALKELERIKWFLWHGNTIIIDRGRMMPGQCQKILAWKRLILARSNS